MQVAQGCGCLCMVFEEERGFDAPSGIDLRLLISMLLVIANDPEREGVEDEVTRGVRSDRTEQINIRLSKSMLSKVDTERRRLEAKHADEGLEFTRAVVLRIALRKYFEAMGKP